MLVRFLLPNVVKQWCRKVISIGVAKKTIRAEIAEKSIITIIWGGLATHIPTPQLRQAYYANDHS